MFDAPEFIEESIQQLKATIDDVAIIACSGGVRTADETQANDSPTV